MDRKQELEKLIRYHSDLYYNKSAPEISDFEFDQLCDELKSLGGTVEVGSASYGKKVTHANIMGSLEKETEVSKIIEWAKKYTTGKVVTTPKIDGLAVELNYKNGKLVQASTRGDGTIGQDVTDNVMCIRNIPKELKQKITADIRGEILMLRTVFSDLVKSGATDLANPRNAASGSLMAKDPQITAQRNLDFICYDIIIGYPFHTEMEKLEYIEKSIPEINLVQYELHNIDDFEKLMKSWERDRPALNYDIDGLVIAINSLSDQKNAGWTGLRPKGKMAFKFPPEQKESTILSIDWQVGRTGKLTPVAYIEPIFLAGSTMRKMTLHNISILRSFNLCINDKVLIERAGDIIPQVVSVTKRPANRIELVYPTKCPVCKGPVELDKRNVSIWCTNANCPAQFEESLIHYIKTLDIIGVGEGIVSGLCKGGYVKSIVDLYNISKDQIRLVTGGDRSAEKVYNAIHDKKEIPLEIFLDSLGIDGLGTSTSKVIAKKFKTLQAVRNINRGDLITMDGIADLTESKIIEGLKIMSNTIDQLRQKVNVMSIKETAGSLTGMSFCLTGAMSKPRKELEKMIEDAGGVAESGVKKGLTYLVQADPSSTSSKSEKALKLGVQIISERDLLTMIG